MCRMEMRNRTHTIHMTEYLAAERMNRTELNTSTRIEVKSSLMGKSKM